MNLIDLHNASLKERHDYVTSFFETEVSDMHSPESVIWYVTRINPHQSVGTLFTKIRTNRYRIAWRLIVSHKSYSCKVCIQQPRRASGSDKAHWSWYLTNKLHWTSIMDIRQSYWFVLYKVHSNYQVFGSPMCTRERIAFLDKFSLILISWTPKRLIKTDL